MTAVFKALNDPTRREILVLLLETDLTAGEIAAKFKISWPSVSHHLDLLRQAGLVLSEREGQYIYYSLDISALDEVSRWLAQFKGKRRPS